MSQTINVCSFGHKFGIPDGTDLRIDVRALKNPHGTELGRLDGRDGRVMEFVIDHGGRHAAIDAVTEILNRGTNVQNVGVGCIGGRHRSVVVARLIADALRALGYDVKLVHRELEQ